MKFSHSLLFNAVPEWYASPFLPLPCNRRSSLSLALSSSCDGSAGRTTTSRASFPPPLFPFLPRGRVLILPPLAPLARRYDALKAQIYKFEKQAVQAQQAHSTVYRDNEEDVEAGPGAGGGTEASKEQNEKVFKKLLDKELGKITEFYVEKGAFCALYLLSLFPLSPFCGPF